MTIADKIRDEKLKTSVLSSGNIDKHEYLTCKVKLPPDQRRVTKQAKFTYCSLGKALEKQTKAIEDLRRKKLNKSN